jgi:pilus assembly protein TadC
MKDDDKSREERREERRERIEEDNEEKEYRKNRKYREDKEDSYSIPILAYFIIIFLWIWIIAGIVAFIASLICFGYNGSMTDKFLGLLLVLVVGPFYWLFFLFNTNYCTRE